MKVKNIMNKETMSRLLGKSTCLIYKGIRNLLLSKLASLGSVIN